MTSGRGLRAFALGAVVLAAMLLAFFWQPLLLGRAFYVYDLSMAYLPIQVENARVRAEGQFPLWNQYMFCGYPINAESESGGLYPPALIFNLPLSPERAYALYITFHYVLAFVAVLYLGAVVGLGLVGRTVAAMTLVFGGTFVAQTVNLPLVTTFAWVPLILGLQVRAMQRRTYGPAVLAGVCLGVQLLGAHPQIVFYGGLLMLLLAVMRPGSERGKPSWGYSIRVFALIMIVGLGLGAPQLFYNLELLRQSDRSGGVSYDFMTMLSFPPQYLGQLLVPGLLGGEEHFIGTEVFEEQQVYWGLVTLGALALGWRMGGRIGWFWRIVLVGSLLLAFGRFVGVYHVLQYVPGFDLFRAPCRWLLPATLAAGMLAGAGIDRVLQREEAARRKSLWVALVYVCLGGVLLPLGARVMSVSQAKGEDTFLVRAYSAMTDWGIQDRKNHLRSVDPEAFREKLYGAMRDAGRSATWAAVLLLVSGAWWLAARFGVRPGILAASLLVLLGLNLWMAYGRFHRFAASDYYTRTNERIELFRSETGLFRIMPLVREKPRDPDPTGLIRNFGSLYKLEVLDGFPSVELETMKKFANGGMTPAQWDMVGAKYFQSPEPLSVPTLRLVYRGKHYIIYENPNVLPRVMVVHNVEIVPDEDELFARLKRPNFNPRRTVLVSREFQYVGDGTADVPAADSVRITRYEGQRVEIEAALAAPGMVVLYDFDYPGWTLGIDGEQRPGALLRVDGIFRGVPLEPGTYKIVFTYRPMSFYAGLDVAVVMLFGVAIWTVTTLAWSRRRP